MWEGVIIRLLQLYNVIISCILIPFLGYDARTKEDFKSLINPTKNAKNAKLKVEQIRTHGNTRSGTRCLGSLIVSPDIVIR